MPAVKNVGEPCAGEPHARIDVAAGGNQASRASTRRAAQAPPADPTTPWACAWLGDAAAYSLDRCLDAVVKMEFGEDAGDVVVDGVGAERELVGDVVIASAAGEPFEDLQFAEGR